MQRLFAAVLLALLAMQVQAAVVSKTVDYSDGDAVLEGKLVWDDAATGQRPGLVIFHAWAGPSANEDQRAEQAAQLGLVVLIADVYGKGIRPTEPEARMAEVTKYRSDRTLMRSRARAAFDTLAQQAKVDATRIVAMGFCFGGTVALELGRSGAPLAGIISVHGGLDTPTPADGANIKGKVLALCGGDDPYVPDDQVQAFRAEMRAGKVDWQIVEYGGAVHAFSDESAGNDPSKGTAYNEKVTKRALAEVRRFLRETLPAEKAE